MPRSSNSNSRVWTPKELSKVPVGELKSIRVSIKRSNVASAGPSTDLIRGIDDPKAISQLVHCKRGALRCAMFDRDDIVVNPEEQFVSIDTRLESSRSRNASRSASRSSRSPEYSRQESRSKERERDKNRSKSDRTPNRDGLRRRSRSPSAEERWKRRSSSREYRRRSRSKSKSASRERFDRPSCSTRRSLSPRPSRKIGAPPTSRSPVIRKRSSSPQRRMSRERSERRRSRSRSRTPRRSEANKYRDRRDERRSRSPLYHSSRRRGSRSRSPPPSGGGVVRRSSSRERRRIRSRSPRDRRRPRSRSRSPRRNGPRGAQHHLDPSTAAGHKMDPYAAAMATAMASYYEHMPPELWMNPAAAAAAAAAATRFPGAGGPVPSRFFGMGAWPGFPPRGGPPLYPRFPLPNYNTPYRPRQLARPVKQDGSATLPMNPPQAASTPLPESTTASASGDGVREVSKQNTNGDDREAKNSDSHEKS